MMQTFSSYQGTESVIDAIKNVAMYVRKSRGDADEDLKKHKHIMEDMCKNYSWNFVEYAEIGSGDSIEDRVAIKELLKDVEAGIYDAVLVFDYDRLGRGSGTDQDTLSHTFKRADVLIVVANPFQILNPNDERDEETMDFKGFMARREYKMITKRLVSGKKIGLRMGRWSNGIAPYGYKYNRDLKILVLDPEESEIYKKVLVVEYLNGKSTKDVAWILNKKKIPSPKGGLWSDQTVRNLLRSEVHLGNIVFNKSEGERNKSISKKPYRKKPQSEWITVKNCHQAIKTEDEHIRILSLMKDKARHTKAGVNALSGLVKCFNCNTTLIIQKKENDAIDVKSCASCGKTRGGDTAIIEHAIHETISKLKEALSQVDNDTFDQSDDEKTLESIIEMEKELVLNEAAISRIEDAFEMGMYNADKAKEKMKLRQENILELENNIRIAKKTLSKVSTVDNNERVVRINSFLSNIGKTKNGETMNEIYKSIIESIIWKRTEWDEIAVTVNFL